MTTTTPIQQALDWMKSARCNPFCGNPEYNRCNCGRSKAIAALSQVVTSVPVAGEPVGHVDMGGKSGTGDKIKWTGWALPHGTALYSASQPSPEQVRDAALRIVLYGVVSDCKCESCETRKYIASDIEKICLQYQPKHTEGSDKS